MEFFSGQANTTQAFRDAKHVAARFDVLYGDCSGKKSNFMDLQEASGFLLLASRIYSLGALASGGFLVLSVFEVFWRVIVSLWFAWRVVHL